MKSRLSIVLRIAITFGCLVIIMFGTVGFFIAHSVRTDVETLAESNYLKISQARAAQIGEFVERFHWQLNALAIQSQLRSKNRAEVMKFIIDCNGKLSPEVAAFFFAWPDGTEILSSGITANLSDRNYFRTIMSGKADWTIGTTVISKTLGVPIVPLALAVKDDRGAIIGLVGFSMKLDKFSEIISMVKAGESGYGWVMDGAGTIIAHPKADLVMKLKVLEADKNFAYRGLSALGQRMLSSGSGFGSFQNAAGVPMTAFYSRIANTQNWVLGITMPKSEIRSASSRIMRLFIFVVAAAIAISLVLTFLLGKSIAGPIVNIADSFKELAEGEADLTKSLESRRNDEIGNLAMDFNRFIAKLLEIVVSLKAAQDELERASVELRANSSETAGAAAQISERVERVGGKTQRQSENVDSASSAVEEIAKNIESLDRLISEQATSVTQASASIEEMVGNIGSVTSSIGKMADEFDALSAAAENGRSVQEITGAHITRISEHSETLLEANSVIEKIASQTISLP